MKSVFLCLLLVAAASAHRLDHLSAKIQEGKADESCTAIGGTCLDWRYYKCTAGYVTGLCSGDSNRRCCQPCDQTCLNNEATWSQSDSACTAISGTCQDKSNYCSGSYSSGKCGGPSTRQCCTKGGAQGRVMTTRGYDLIKGFEGLCLHSYQDVGGVWTIGYGSIRYPNGTSVKGGETITNAQADEMFAYEVDQESAPEVDRLVGLPSPDITQVQYEALVSFTYNVGTGAFGSSTLLAKVKVNPNDPTIRDEFMRWVNVNGQPVQGLINRRDKEADYYFAVDNSVWPPATSCSKKLKSPISTN